MLFNLSINFHRNNKVWPLFSNEIHWSFFLFKKDKDSISSSDISSPVLNAIDDDLSCYSPRICRLNLSKDEMLVDGLLSSLNSPYQSISSPLIPLTIESPTNSSSMTDKTVPSTSSFSTTSTIHSNEQTSTKKSSSFNRSLPHSLVSWFSSSSSFFFYFLC